MWTAPDQAEERHDRSTTSSRGRRACWPAAWPRARSPHPRAGAAGVAPAEEPRTDFRSPDTRDAAEGYAPKLVAPAQQAAQRTDFRSPDTRDAADGYAPTLAAEPVVETQASEAGGFDWGSAGIAVAAAAGLFILALAMVGGVRHGRRRVARP